eukprot:4567705-Pleurochrysis_carterae.AAC.2
MGFPGRGSADWSNAQPVRIRKRPNPLVVLPLCGGRGQGRRFVRISATSSSRNHPPPLPITAVRCRQRRTSFRAARAPLPRGRLGAAASRALDLVLEELSGADADEKEDQ